MTQRLGVLFGSLLIAALMAWGYPANEAYSSNAKTIADPVMMAECPNGTCGAVCGETEIAGIVVCVCYGECPGDDEIAIQ